MSNKDETNHYLSLGSGPVFWKNVDPEFWIIFWWFQIRALGLLDYLGIDLTIWNKNPYSNKSNGYKWWTIRYHVRIHIWTQNWSDSAPEFWKNRIISELAWPFRTNLHIQVKIMDIRDGVVFWKKLRRKLRPVL